MSLGHKIAHKTENAKASSKKLFGRATGNDRLKAQVRHRTQGVLMIIAGVIMLVAGLLIHLTFLLYIGIVVFAVGLVLRLMGSRGHAVAGRRHYF
jgi:Zn-dependent membrane protease YugP